MFRYYFFISSFFSTLILFSQYEETKPSDTIGFQGLVEILNSNDSSIRKDRYAKILLDKAKRENQFLFLVGGYEIMADISEDYNKSLKYLDTVIQLTKDNPDYFYPANAYLSKGSILYEKLKYKDALSNYLVAKEYGENYPNQKFLYHSNHGIALIKNRLGDYQSAHELHQRNLDYFIKDTIRDLDRYLNSLIGLIVSKINLGEYEKVLQLTKKGGDLAKRHHKIEKFNLLRIDNGVANFYTKNYNICIDSLKNSISSLERFGDNQNLILVNYYLGLAYEYTSGSEEALPYYNVVDSLVSIDSLIDIQALPVYRHLYDYYRKKNNITKQLASLQKMITIDSVLDSNAEIIGSTVAQRYDLVELKKEKEVLTAQLNGQNSLNKFLVLILLLLAATSWTWVNYRKRLLKKRFDMLILNPIPKNSSKLISKKPEFDVPKDVTKSILEKLKEFEIKKEFIDETVTLSSLAKSFATNSNYLSKIINHHKEMNFSTYINGLRINHAIEELKNDKEYDKYTIRAIASMMGFKSAETFSKAFKAQTGIYPSYFLERMKDKDK